MLGFKITTLISIFINMINWVTAENNPLIARWLVVESGERVGGSIPRLHRSLWIEWNVTAARPHVSCCVLHSGGRSPGPTWSTWSLGSVWTRRWPWTGWTRRGCWSSAPVNWRRTHRDGRCPSPDPHPPSSPFDLSPAKICPDAVKAPGRVLSSCCGDESRTEGRRALCLFSVKHETKSSWELRQVWNPDSHGTDAGSKLCRRRRRIGKVCLGWRLYP